MVAKAERAEGACQNKKDPENDSVAEQEASVALSEANEGSRAGGAVGDSERTTETEEPIGSAGHGEDGVTEEGVVRASEEDGQTEQQQVNSAGKRAADESGSLGPGDAEKECERETASPHLPECLESSAGRSKGELLGETSTDGGQRLPRKSETQRPSRAADSPPSGAGKPEVQARGPEVRQRCPNHLEGDEHVPRTVDMEAETEPESDASQSADLREEGIGSGGAAEVQSALAERAADVSSPAAGEGAHAHELVEAAAASRGRAEGKATGEEGLVGGKLFETTLPDGSEEVRQGTTSDYHGGSRVQRKFEDDSTEPPDVSPVSPAFGQRERGPASPHVEIAPERKPSTVDFEADKAGWFTAARGRKGFLVGLTKETVKLDASGGVGACALAVDGAAVAGEKITTKRKLDAVDDRVIEETEQQETESRAGIDRNGPAVRSNLGGVRSRDLGVRGEQASDRVGGLGSLSGNANDGASVGDRKTAGPLRGVATKSLSEQGVQVGERFQQAAAVGAVGVEDEEGPAAAGLRSGSPVRGGGTQEGKRKVKRLSLTPFKRWKAAGEGDDAAEKVKDDVAGGGGIAGQPVSEHGKGPANLSGATKRKMAELGTLAAFGWEAEKERRAAASGVGQAGREEQGKITQLEPDVSEGGVGLRSESGGTVTAECGRSKESGLGCGLEPGPENWETDEVAAAVTSAEKAVHDGLENEGREQTAALEGRRVDGLTRGPGEKPAVRIVGSDSLTEQQSELQCSEPESKEGEEPAELEQAAGTIAASAGFAEAGGEYSVPALQGGGVECLEQKLRPTSKVLPVEKEPDGDDREDADQVEGTGPKASENDGSSAVRKGGLMPLNPHVNAPPTRPLSGRLGEPAERGRPASPVTQRQRSPKAPPQGASSPPPPSERSHSSSWIGRTVETISAAFRAPAGYKPLALTRSRDPVVSNGATGPPAPKDDTAEEDWPGKSRPRNKSWPVWKGPTSNPNLGKVGGSAQKAPPAGARGEGPEVPKAAEIIAVTSALGANRGRALESQARRLGRFEESEAVRDWPAGELLVPSTPPDTPAEETPSKEEDHAGDPSKAEAAPGEGPEEGGLVPRGGGLMGGLKSGSGEAGQGLLRPVCCLVQQKGPVLWSVIHVASREVRLGVCVETDKAQRSVFVYSLSKGVEQGEWKVAVAGEIAGTVRPSEGLEQVSVYPA